RISNVKSKEGKFQRTMLNSLLKQQSTALNTVKCSFSKQAKNKLDSFKERQWNHSTGQNSQSRMRISGQQERWEGSRDMLVVDMVQEPLSTLKKSQLFQKLSLQL